VTPLVAARVEHARKDEVMRKLALPSGRPGAMPVVVFLLCLAGAVVATVLGVALS
jgi:hypothetical protein